VPVCPGRRAAHHFPKQARRCLRFCGNGVGIGIGDITSAAAATFEGGSRAVYFADQISRSFSLDRPLSSGVGL